MELYPEQQELLDNILAQLKSKNRLLVVHPTGGGKTVVLSFLAKVLEGSTLVLVHRKEVVQQNYEKLVKVLGTDVGLLQAGQPQSQAHVNSGSIQTIASWIKRGVKPEGFRQIKNLIIDEAHLNKADMLDRILKSDWLHPDCKIIGFTATPCTLTGKPLGDVYHHLVKGSSTRELQTIGRIPLFRVLASPQYINLEGVKKSSTGDYNQKMFDKKNPPSKVAALVQSAWESALDTELVKPDGIGLIFANSVEASQYIERDFKSKGIRVAHIDAKTPKPERDEIVRQLRAGELNIITNVSILAEGFDCPTVDWVMLARPTASLAVHLQQFGRGLRGTGEVIIIDPAGNSLRHGLPTDYNEWSLTDSSDIIMGVKWYEGSDKSLHKITTDNIGDLKIAGFTEIKQDGTRVVHEAQPDLDFYFNKIRAVRPGKCSIRFKDALNVARSLHRDPEQQAMYFKEYIAYRERLARDFAMRVTRRRLTKKAAMSEFVSMAGSMRYPFVPTEEYQYLLTEFGFKPGMRVHLKKDFEAALPDFDPIDRRGLCLMELAECCIDRLEDEELLIKRRLQDSMDLAIQQCKRTSAFAEQRKSLKSNQN